MMLCLEGECWCRCNETISAQAGEQADVAIPLVQLTRWVFIPLGTSIVLSTLIKLALGRSLKTPASAVEAKRGNRASGGVS